jgi:hypothetical protein
MCALLCHAFELKDVSMARHILMKSKRLALGRHAVPLLIVAAIATLVGLSQGKASSDEYSRTVQYREELALTQGGQLIRAEGVMQIELAVASGGIGPVYNGRGVRASNRWLEAIPIPVGTGDYVFALPTYPYDASIHRLSLLYTACDLPADERSKSLDVLKHFIDLVASLNRRCDVPASSWPILIHFKDRTRPDTAERLFPADLESRFGTVLQSVTVERTDAAPTHWIEALLPWVLDRKETFGMPIATVEKHPRSRPIVLTQEDFLWPSPIRQVVWKRQGKLPN